MTMHALSDANQHHVVAAYELLPAPKRAALEEQLAEIDQPDELVKTVQAAIRHSASAAAKEFAPLPRECTALTLEDTRDAARWLDLGLEAIARGEVAVLLLAGGQGTRLGSTAPKGCYDVGLFSKRSLFHIQAEKIAKVQQLAAAKFGGAPEVPWYIMTLDLTRAATQGYFEQHRYFGLAPSQVTFFDQGTLPCFSLDGSRMLMELPLRICELPDGNGGLYKALVRHNIVADLKRRGVQHLHMYCVDNCLVRVADPVFIGFAIDRGFDLATKAVRKRDAAELVGLIVLDKHARKACVVEYSEIPKTLAEMPDPADPGKLHFRAANIVNHYYSLDLLERMLPQWILLREHLPFHIAKKKIKCYDVETAQYVSPTEPNGLKLEQFIFDVFPSVPLERFGCLEVDRAEEFSPLKNAPLAPNDNATCCRRHFLELCTRWVRASGGVVPEGALVEVSGALSYAGEGLLVAGREFKDGDII